MKFNNRHSVLYQQKRKHLLCFSFGICRSEKQNTHHTSPHTKTQKTTTHNTRSSSSSTHSSSRDSRECFTGGLEHKNNKTQNARVTL
jgi:hypothetical protein